MKKVATKKNVLVTGGLGSIGHVLCARLLKDGYGVVIVDDLSVGRKEFLEELPWVKFYQCDIADYRNFEKAFSENAIDAVVHLAAKHYIPYCTAHPKEAMETNIFGTLNTLLLMRQYNVLRLVFASTSSVYKPSVHPYKEDDELGPVNFYGISKLLCENAIQSLSSEYGITYTILRFYNAYGPNDLVHHVIPEIVKQARFSDVIKVGNLDSKRDFIRVEDIVDAIAKCLVNEAAHNNIYNVGTGRALSIREVIQAVSKAAHKEFIIEEDEAKKRASDPPMLLADASKIALELGWQADRDFSLDMVFADTKFWPSSE